MTTAWTLGDPCPVCGAKTADCQRCGASLEYAAAASSPKSIAQEGEGHASAAGNAGHHLPGAAVATPPAPAQYRAMTTASELAAAAASECRRILAEKDRLLTAARDERDAARGEVRVLVGLSRSVLSTHATLNDHLGEASWEDDAMCKEVIEGGCEDYERLARERWEAMQALAREVARLDRAPVPPGETRRAATDALRPEVLAFARVMSAKIDGHNADRGEYGWRTATKSDLYERLRRYYGALCDALGTGLPPEVITSKAANVANLAMMIADVFGAYAAPAAHSETTRWPDDPEAP